MLTDHYPFFIFLFLSSLISANSFNLATLTGSSIGKNSCYYSLGNLSFTDPTSSSNVLDASSLSAIRIVDTIRLAPVDLTA
jgi:spore coat protein U-like protein